MIRPKGSLGGQYDLRIINMPNAELTENYYIRTENNAVELWSRIRIPFETKGWPKDMKESLRLSIKSLCRAEQSMLYAVYIAEQSDYCDVENILLYNVGSGAFSNLCRKGLCFERRYSKPPKCSEPTGNMEHYHCYKLVSQEQSFEHWNIVWENVSFPAIRSDSKPHSFWYAMKNPPVRISSNVQIPAHFGMELRIKAPYGTNINLAAVVKPLLDGNISAFQVHDGTNMSSLKVRLSDLIGVEQDLVVTMLMDSTGRGA